MYVETKIKNDIEFYLPGAHILSSKDLTHNLVKLRGILRNKEQINKERMKKRKQLVKDERKARKANKIAVIPE